MLSRDEDGRSSGKIDAINEEIKQNAAFEKWLLVHPSKADICTYVAGLNLEISTLKIKLIEARGL